MAQQNLVGSYYIPNYPIGVSTLPNISTALVIDAADESVAFVIQAPKTGNISDIQWGTRTVTTGATLDIRVESVDTATGFPSGTLLDTTTNGAQVVADANDNVVFTTALTSAAAVTRGQLIAIVIKNPTASFGNMVISSFSDGSDSLYPFACLNTGVSPAVSYAKVAVAPMLGLEYDDGSYVPVPTCYPAATTITSTAFNNTSTPDSIGLRFQMPYPCTVGGFWLWTDLDGDCDVKLVSSAYHQANATGILASLTIDKDTDASATSGLAQFLFATPVEIDSGTDYRLVIEPTSATSVTIYDFTLASLAAMDSWDGGQTWHLTTAKDPTGDGDWTNYNSGTFRKPYMGVMITSGDDAVQTGGGSIFNIME